MILNAADIVNANILIVDDQHSNVQLLEQVLTEAGYLHLTSTLNSLEVCELHRIHNYDVILLDLQMPGMDGFEVMEGLKANLSDSYLPVIVLTAQPAHKLRALQAGAKDFISKPFDLVEVKTRIHNMLEVRLLYKKLASYNELLEITVAERTAELRASEERYRRLTELASDWYWEQDDNGEFTQISGPVLDMLGIINKNAAHNTSNSTASITPNITANIPANNDGWDTHARSELQGIIDSRQPFIDFAFSRTLANGSQQHYRVSGEPMFDLSCRFIGYRGVGVEYRHHLDARG